MFKRFKREWSQYFLICFNVITLYLLIGAFIIISIGGLSAMLSSSLTAEQVNDIKTKISAYNNNLELVSIKDKQLLGCGNGHFYMVPLEVKNKDGLRTTISYCSGGFFTPSQLKI